MILFVLLLGTLVVPSSAQQPVRDPCVERVAQLRETARQVHDKQHNIGLAVAIERAGKIVYSEGFGFADLEDSVPVKSTTRFTVASVTKAFTGVALLLAAQRGVIDLDAPIQRYVPRFPVKPEGVITARLLAAHLGGIRHWRNERTPALYAQHFDDIDQILPLFENDSLVVAPGTRYSYSSYGYNLIGAALQAAQRTPYQQIVTSEIITPLGLTHTRFDDVRQVIPDRARHYSFYDLTSFAELTTPVRVPDWDYSHNMAAGDILTTAEDLVQLGDALTHPGLLSAASLDLLYTRPRVGSVESPMSFGWFVDSVGVSAPRRIYITGSNAGVQAGLYVVRAAQLTVAVISNTWGIGSRSGELVGSGANDLPSRLIAICTSN